MRINTLGCDLCRGVVPAVVTLSLASDGKLAKGAPSIDVCQGHLTELQKAFKPRKRSKFKTAMGRGRQSPTKNADRVEKKRSLSKEPGETVRKQAAKYAESESRGPKYQARMDQAVLAAIPNSGTRIAAPAIQAASKVTHGGVMSALHRLIAAGLVQAHGGKSRWRTYERV